MFDHSGLRGVNGQRNDGRKHKSLDAGLKVHVPFVVNFCCSETIALWPQCGKSLMLTNNLHQLA